MHYEGVVVKVPEGWEIPIDYAIAQKPNAANSQKFFMYPTQSVFFVDAESKYALLRLRNKESGKYHLSYLDRQGNVTVPIERPVEATTNPAPFFQGIAGAATHGGEGNPSWLATYYTQEGDVIASYDRKFEAIGNPYSTGSLIMSEFKDGFAYVFRNVSNGLRLPRQDEWDERAAKTKEISASFAKINQKGELISDWSEKQVIIPAEAWVDERGLSYNNYLNHPSAQKFHFTREIRTVPYGPGVVSNAQLSYYVGADYAMIATGEDELRIVPISAFAKKESPATRYQSTVKLTSGLIVDLDYSDFGLTVTNPTDGYDSGTIALVLASDNATIHFVDYSLAPKESKTYSVAVAGHMAIKYGHRLTLLDGGWGAFLNADIITFESDEDLASYRAAIPYEQNKSWMVTQGAGDDKNTNIVVCDDTAGDSWLKNYTGIQRHSQTTLDSNISHNICKAGGR